MMELYFALKFWLTIIPIIIVVLLIILIVISALFETIRGNRNEKYLKKQGFKKDLNCYNQWCYKKDGVWFVRERLGQYTLREIKKEIKGE